MKKKIFLSLFLAVSATVGIIKAADPSTRKVNFVLSDGTKLTRSIPKNLIDQSNVLKNLTTDSSGPYVYNVKDPDIFDTHLNKLSKLLEFIENNNFSKPENITKAIDNFKKAFLKPFSRPGMYEPDLKIANEFDIPNLKEVLNTLEAREHYFVTGGDINIHFNGVSIQDLINHKRIPQIINNELDLSDQYISSLDGIENIPDLENLRKLDLRNNLITTFPAHIKGLENLEALFLSNNNITTFPIKIEGLEKLELLHLKNNQITTIPSIIEKLPSLRQVWLDHNHIRTIPDNIEGMPNLRMLSLKGNLIKTLPNNIEGMPNLRVLSLNKNPIRPKKVGGITISAQEQIDQLQNNINTSPSAATELAIMY